MTSSFLNPQPVGEAPAAVRRVLVVDDSPVVGEVTAEMLAALGYHAIACTSADEAMRRLARGGIDAVLTEVGLATADGRRLASLLSQEHPDLPVAVLTGWFDHPEGRFIDRHGVRMVLTKPLHIVDLDLAVRTLMNHFPL